jgi:hypothetical protein
MLSVSLDCPLLIAGTQDEGAIKMDNPEKLTT